MPSKSDIQFGKIALKNHFAAKDEVEGCLKDQSRFERERHTTVIEAVFLARDILDVGKIEAIQKAMKRRVIFCGKCSAKYNVFQFKGGDKFACNKCGAKVEVPDESGYRKVLRHQAGEVDEVLKARPEPVFEEPAAKESPARETIVLTKEAIEAAKSRPRQGSAPAEPADGESDEAPVEEVELEAVVEEETEAPSEEPAADEPPPAPAPKSEAPKSAAQQKPSEGDKKPIRKIRLKSGSPEKKDEPPPAPESPAKEQQGSPPRRVKLIKKSDKVKKTR